MTKRLYTLRTGNWDWGPIGGPKNIWIGQGVKDGDYVPFTVEKIDVYWSAVPGADLQDTFYFNWGFGDEFPDTEFTGFMQPDRLTVVGAASEKAFCNASWKSADFGDIPGSRVQGPYAWSPGPGNSHHSFDLTEIGGLTIDKTVVYPVTVLSLRFWHDLTYYGHSYRMIITVSEDT